MKDPYEVKNLTDNITTDSNDQLNSIFKELSYTLQRLSSNTLQLKEIAKRTEIRLARKRPHNEDIFKEAKPHSHSNRR